MGPSKPDASPRPVVLDTDVLVWYLRGDERARKLLQDIAPSRRLLSAVVRMELVRGVRDRPELRRLVGFLDSAFARTIHITQDISRRATTLVERHALAHRIAPDDALIAATALNASALLATANLRDYTFVSGLDVMPFRPRSARPAAQE